jgi:hypothetical protein
LLHHQKRLVEHALEEFEKDASEVIAGILSDAQKLTPRKK